MNIFDPTLPIKVLFILGIINLISGLMIFFTCRCIPGSRIGGKLMQHQTYKNFYKYHCYIWRVFWPSVIVHALLALIYLGWPG